MKTAADIPEALAAHRAELERHLQADLEGAVQYANKALDLQRSAALIKAEISGIDRAISAYRERVIELASQSRHGPPRMATGD